MTDQQMTGTRQRQVHDPVPAPLPSQRRWFGLRRHPVAPAVDLREDEYELQYDPQSVLARLARLRDAGLITNAELESERRALLGAAAHQS